MRHLHFILRDFPAFTRMIALLLAINLIAFVSVRLFLRDSRPTLFLLGDSCISNYRMSPGERIQDFLQNMEPGLHVENWAYSGAAPLDFLLQVCKGRFLSSSPHCVIITMGPDKFNAENRLNDETDLRWLPINRTGLKIWKVLSPQERDEAVVQKTGLALYGFVDLTHSLWTSYWKWPQRRHAMRHASPWRRRKIEAQVREIGTSLETQSIGGNTEFAAQTRAKDAQLLLDVLREQGIETLVIIHPYGNPLLVARNFSPLAIAKRDTLNLRMRNWLDARDVSYLDFDSPQERRNFPDSVWDDYVHMKAAHAFYYLSQKTAGWLSANCQNLPHCKTVANHARIQTPGKGS